MSQLSLETIAQRLSEHLRCEQEDLCRPILRTVSRGKSLSKAQLSTALQIEARELEQRLMLLPDTEFDQEGNIVGWGVTLLPTHHRFQMNGKALFTWCAFDTVLFPPSLSQSAQVQSRCHATGEVITFVATADGGVEDLSPLSAVMSLIIPTHRQECVRATFCEQSLFFQSEQAAGPFRSIHPGALLLSIQEAAQVGTLVAASRFMKENGRL